MADNDIERAKVGLLAFNVTKKDLDVSDTALVNSVSSFVPASFIKVGFMHVIRSGKRPPTTNLIIVSDNLYSRLLRSCNQQVLGQKE